MRHTSVLNTDKHYAEKLHVRRLKSIPEVTVTVSVPNQGEFVAAQPVRNSFLKMTMEARSWFVSRNANALS